MGCFSFHLRVPLRHTRKDYFVLESITTSFTGEPLTGLRAALPVIHLVSYRRGCYPAFYDERDCTQPADTLTTLLVLVGFTDLSSYYFVLSVLLH